MKGKRDFLGVLDLSRKEFLGLIDAAAKIKKKPQAFAGTLKGKSLLMVFEAPSLRTRLSFESGMTQLGGHAIAYNLGESTVGKKESAEDFARTFSRYCDAAALRLYDHTMLERIAKASSIPVINMMTNAEHPCQILGDFMTIAEKKTLKKIKIAYVGDGDNNVTYSLMLASALLGIDIAVASPKNYQPKNEVVNKGKRVAKGSIHITHNPGEAVKDADVVYTDTWMSYRIPESEKPERVRKFSPYQVNASLMKKAPKALFMHCLPAGRGYEVTDEVIDGKQSMVFDQAENRMHAQKALILWLLGKMKI
ncbi:MAG: ornithine carbamoyltransferase [Candidatus Aenigmarchaeota archaeon]|nr:ornithine carbamoyltransferase [Candidatus Aenigmarchaeota archaeon]